MKKLLVILMVVAMASFLFVGCIPTTPEEVVEEEEEEEEEVVVVATVAPLLTSITTNAAVPVAAIDLTATATQYLNAADVALGIIVNGTAPTYSEVKVYVDDVCAGTADVGVTGIFSVVVAEADLGADGDKVIYATAKEAAIDVSAHSVEYAFVLDQVKPSATTLAATAATALALDSAIVSGNSIAVDSFGVQGLGTLAAGTWTITCVGDSAATSNVTISDGTTTTTYTADDGDIFDGVIPGVYFVFAAGLDAGDVNTVTITTAIADRATILFSEEVTYASAMAAANFTWLNNTTGLALADVPITYYSNTTYFTPFVAALAVYDSVRCIVNGLVDLAGNTQTTASVVTCTAAAASLTSLAP